MGLQIILINNVYSPTVRSAQLDFPLLKRAGKQARLSF